MDISTLLNAVISGMAICAFVLFDLLVRAEYMEHPDAWRASGGPWGFLWRPAEPSSFFNGWTSRSVVWFAWLFRTPKWAAGSDKHRAMLWQIRVCVAGAAIISYAMSASRL